MIFLSSVVFSLSEIRKSSNDTNEDILVPPLIIEFAFIIMRTELYIHTYANPRTHAHTHKHTYRHTHTHTHSVRQRTKHARSNISINTQYITSRRTCTCNIYEEKRKKGFLIIRVGSSCKHCMTTNTKEDPLRIYTENICSSSLSFLAQASPRQSSAP